MKMCWVHWGVAGECVRGEGRGGYNRDGAERGKSSLIHLYTACRDGVWYELSLSWALAFPGENTWFGLEERVG